MKKKFMTFLFCAMLVICGGGILALSTGCGEQEYDMTNVVLDTTVDYDGTAKSIYAQNLPEGLDVKYHYYDDDTYTTEIDADKVVDAGQYWVKAVFTAGEGYKTPAEMTAKLIINKVKFTNVQVTIGASYTVGQEDKMVVAKDNGNNEFSLEFEAVRYFLELNSVNVDSSVQKTVAYYSALNEDGTVDVESKLDEVAGSVLENYNDDVYMVVTLSDNNTNHIDTDIINHIRIDKKVKEVSTYEDLVQMNRDVYELSPTVRANLKYVLTQDIDCEEQVWQTIAPKFVYDKGTPLNPNNEDYSFRSEFDGNEHKIYNFKITNDSLKYNLTLYKGTDHEQQIEVDAIDPIKNVQDDANRTYAKAYGTVQAGFFGYIVGANIHDVTFEKIEADININDTYIGQLKSGRHLYFGVVAGRAENADQYSIVSDASSVIENIKVKDVNALLIANKVFAGGILGAEHNKNTDTKTFARKDLVVENANITVRSGTEANTDSNNRLSLGGIIGETQSGDVVLYENCKVLGGSLSAIGAIPNTDMSNEGYYSEYGIRMVGALIGWNRSADVSVKDCYSDITIKLYAKNEANSAKYITNEIVGRYKTDGQTDDIKLLGENNVNVSVELYYAGVLQQDTNA